jgi:hypothetical protein
LETVVNGKDSIDPGGGDIRYDGMVEGVVVRIDPDKILVDLGLTPGELTNLSELPISALPPWLLDSSGRPTFHVHDKIAVYVSDLDQQQWQTLQSRKPPDEDVIQVPSTAFDDMGGVNGTAFVGIVGTGRCYSVRSFREHFWPPAADTAPSEIPTFVYFHSDADARAHGFIFTFEAALLEEADVMMERIREVVGRENQEASGNQY